MRSQKSITVYNFDLRLINVYERMREGNMALIIQCDITKESEESISRDRCNNCSVININRKWDS